MPLLCCRQSFGRTFTLSPPTARRAMRAPLLQRRDVMSSFLYAIAILALMSRPLLAQGVEMPPQAPRPQPPYSSPQAGESREGAADRGNPRFVFHRSDGGFVRLDLVTGAIASCSQNAADWTCVPGRDERAALDREIVRLQRDNAALKNALLEHGVPLPNDMKADASAVPAETIPRPPQTVPPTASAPPPSAKSGEAERASRDDAEVERIMAMMEKVWRRLVEMMMNIQRDLQKKG
jgi:hypothetical protein